MKAIELKKMLDKMPDDTEIIIESQMCENEGEFLKAGDIYVGYCDPDDDRVDGLYVALAFVSSEGVDIPVSRLPNTFPVLALSLTKTSPRSIYMED